MSASKFTLSGGGDATSMAIHCKVASGTSLMKMAIYSDSSGSPSAKLGVTNEISVSNTTSAYQTASFASPVTLGAGDYWLTFMQDNAGTGFCPRHEL